MLYSYNLLGQALADFEFARDVLMFQKHLVHLASEIIEDIISFIDALNDLSALSQTCHLLHKLIVPRHLDYRHICCLISEAFHIWTALAQNRNLARFVRSLCITIAGVTNPIRPSRSIRSKHLPARIEPRPGQPSAPTSEDPTKIISELGDADGLLLTPKTETVPIVACESIFIAALKNMTQLHDLHWEAPNLSFMASASDKEIQGLWGIFSFIPPSVSVSLKLVKLFPMISGR